VYTKQNKKDNIGIMSEERENKNMVFANQQQTSPIENVKAEFGLDIPNELVPIPSCGKSYPIGHSLHGKELLEITPMTTREEDILTSRAILKKGTVITELIKSCILDKSVDPVDLLVGDRNALMVAIRVTGYGAGYDAEVECPACSVKTKQTFDLTSLPIKHLEIEPVSPGENAFQFLLPHSKKRVTFKFMTGRDEQEISATQDKQKKLGLSSDALVTTNLLYSILSIEGVTDRSKISAFVRKMPARDSLALRSYIRNNEPGIEMKQSMACPSCGHEEEVGMPINTGFLWPNT
jgi:hypothetical protein